jgi:deoxycytidylate deaminase
VGKGSNKKIWLPPIPAKVQYAILSTKEIFMKTARLNLSGLPKPRSNSKAVLKQKSAHELFFAVVGPVGAGASHAARQLERKIVTTKIDGMAFTCDVIKAGDAIRAWAEKEGHRFQQNEPAIDLKARMQGFGDEMRKERKDDAAVAVDMIERISEARARSQGKVYVPGQPVEPDGKPRAYILDSLKNPAEAFLLRRLYGNAFVLIGVVCSEPVRRQRLLANFFTLKDAKKNENKKKIDQFVRRDADDEEHKYGQHVTDTFHEADFFVDNTPEVDPQEADSRLIGEFDRLFSIIVHQQIVRPSIEETAMHTAYSAKLQSSCLSRQVGASLVDRHGNVVATGTNEVPRAGGGVYGEETGPLLLENRCAFCHNGDKGAFCSNNVHQNELISEALDALFGPAGLSHEEKELKLRTLRKTQLGGLLEFSRSVHAEMDALLSAARSGVSPVGSRLFVTTFPCHFCARHIVSAGVYEVQYIEPYPKSRALTLHGDAIETVPENWIPPRELQMADRREQASPAAVEALASATVGKAPNGVGKVLFKPFVGIAPKLYGRVFLKDREYKNKVTGEFSMQDAEWGSPWSQYRVSYAHLETEIIGKSNSTRINA